MEYSINDNPLWFTYAKAPTDTNRSIILNYLATDDGYENFMSGYVEALPEDTTSRAWGAAAENEYYKTVSLAS